MATLYANNCMLHLFAYICGCILHNTKVIFIFISFKQELVTCAYWYAEEVPAKLSHSCYLNVHKLKIEPRRMDWWIIRLVVKPSNFRVASLNSRIYMLLPEAPFSFSTPKDCLSSLWMRSRHPFKIMRKIFATKDSELLADEHLDGKIDRISIVLAVWDAKCWE